MLRRLIVASAAVAVAAATPGGTAFAANSALPLTDVSAQPVVRKGPPPAPAQRVAPRVVPQVAPRVAPRVVNPQFAPRVAPRVVNPQINPQFAPRVAPRVVNPGVVGPRVVAPRFVPRISPGARGASFVGGRQVFINRGAYRARYGGRIVTFVGIGAVAAVLVGARYYQPYGYVEVEAPACTGLTDDGCELRLTEVPTEEGDLVPQCVQFCPPAE